MSAAARPPAEGGPAAAAPAAAAQPPAALGGRASARFVLLTFAANGVGLLYAAWAGRVLDAAAAADYFAASFVMQAVYMAGHPLNGVVARLGADASARGARHHALQLQAYVARLLLRALPVLALVALLTLPALTARLQFADPYALPLGWLGGALALWLGVLRGALRGALLLAALAASFLVEALARVALGVGLLAVWPQAAVALAAHALGACLAIFLGGRALATLGAEAPPGASDIAVDGALVRRWLLPMFALSLVDAAWQNAGALFAKAALPAVDAAGFGAAFTLTRLFAVITQPFALLVIPAMVGQGAVDSRRSLLRLWAGFLGLSLVCLAGLAAFAAPALGLVFGAAYRVAAPLLLPLAIGAVCSFAAMIIGQAFAAVGRFAFLVAQAALLLLLPLAWPDEAASGATAALDLAWRLAALQAAGLFAAAVFWVQGGRAKR